jgi:hypothetical protein
MTEVQGWGIFDRHNGEFSTGVDTRAASASLPSGTFPREGTYFGVITRRWSGLKKLIFPGDRG